MQVIPVIDLMNDVVVHACKGEREHYRPITSRLCNSSHASEVLEGLLGLYPFPILYIADLDAIQKRGHHLELVKQLLQQHSKLEVWIDAGINSVNDIKRWKHDRLHPVLGTESIPDFTTWQQLSLACKDEYILSLDFTHVGYQGPAEILQKPHLWPKDIIIMNLPYVGSQNGPDMTKLESFRNQQPLHHIYAAGGTRNLADLQLLQAKGIHGVLIASALHNGNLDKAALNTIITP